MVANQPLDRTIGSRIRNARLARGLSMVELGEATGVSYQQIQKYETGANRVSASALYQIASVLDIEVSSFFPKAEDPTIGSDLMAKLDSIPLDARGHLVGLIDALARGRASS